MRLVERPEMCLILFIMRNRAGIGTHLGDWGWSCVRHAPTSQNLALRDVGQIEPERLWDRSDTARTFSELRDAADPWHNTVSGGSPRLMCNAHTIAGHGAA